MLREMKCKEGLSLLVVHCSTGMTISRAAGCAAASLCQLLLVLPGTQWGPGFGAPRCVRYNQHGSAACAKWVSLGLNFKAICDGNSV